MREIVFSSCPIIKEFEFYYDLELDPLRSSLMGTPLAHLILSFFKSLGSNPHTQTWKFGRRAEGNDYGFSCYFLKFK